jgi:beta-RFAP synthase
MTTGARLHFGPLALSSASCRYFGGIGMMIADPGVELTVETNEPTSIIAPAGLTERVTTTLSRLETSTGRPFRGRLTVVKQIPPHTGLGSGTQLELALARLHAWQIAEDCPDSRTMAERTVRGGRSAIGIGGFTNGGFLVDVGRKPNQQMGLISQRLEVPEAWPVLLCSKRRETGLSGVDERSVFHAMPEMPLATTQALSYLAFLQIVPALLERDYDQFAIGLRTYGRTVGEFFARFQDGAWVHPSMRDIAESLWQKTPYAFAQSSWGPTLAVILPEEAVARELAERLGETFDVECLMTRPLNRGASLEAR